jgi:hypothetical protein
MVSEARIQANIRNAKKSTGPRTEAGKERSRSNAVTHGMTARIVLLPDEDLDDFRRRMSGWFDSLKPRNQAEVYLTERVGYFAWQTGRTVRAQSARLCVKAHTGASDKQSRLERETVELSQRLFRAPFGRPAACPYHHSADAQAAQAVTGEFDYADHPKRLVGQLEATLPGCKFLLDQWSDLETALEQGLGWEAPERFRALRMLGMHPIDSFMNERTARLFQALEVLDPRGGSLVREFWNEIVTADALPDLEAQYQRRIAHAPAPDQEAARQHILNVVRWETSRLELDLPMHERRAELEAEMSPHLQAVDDSREGELLRRYEATCEKLFFRHMDEVYRRRAEKAQRGEPAHAGGYFRPSPTWFQARKFREEVAAMADHDDCTDPCDADDERDLNGTPHGARSETQFPNSKIEIRNSKAVVRNEPNDVGELPDTQVLRNEPNEGGELPDTQVLRNEPNRVGERLEAHVLRNEANGVGEAPVVQIRVSEMTAAVEEALASQPPPAITAGQRRDRSHGNAVIESRRGRKRRERNRQNAERAAAARANDGNKR